MKALVYTAPGEMAVLDDVPEPTPAAGEVLVRVAAVGICGSELEGFATRSPMRVPPLVMGHEFSGTRVDTRERVVVNPMVSCGRCDVCLRGLFNVCRDRAIIGIHRSGGFGELVAVPETAVHVLPDELGFETAALTEPIANAVHAWRVGTAYDQVPHRVGVIGAGAVGLMAAIVALRRGVPEVVVADLSPERRDAARRAGATAVAERLEGEFDIVFDAVGTEGTRHASVASVRPGGTAVWIGLHGAEAGFDGLDLIRWEKRVLGTFCYTDADFRQAISIARTLRHDWIATHPLARGAEVFLDLVERTPAAVKSMLVSSAEEPS